MEIGSWKLKITREQPGAGGDPGQPGHQYQPQKQFVAVEGGNQLAHQHDLGDGRGEADGGQSESHRRAPWLYFPAGDHD